MADKKMNWNGVLAESFYLSYDLPVSIIRPFNTYGPRQSARAVIPTIIIQNLSLDKIPMKYPFTRTIFALLLFFGMFIALQYTYSSPINVPLDHWSYQFIERFQAKGALKDCLSSIKPYSRDDLAKMIFRISKLQENGEVCLSKVEDKQLELLKKEFKPELADLGMGDIAEYKSTVNWSDGKKRFITQIGYTQEATLKRGTEDIKDTKSTLQVVFQGNLGGGVFFYNDSRASYTTEPLPIWHPYTVPARYPWNATSDAYLIFKLPWTNPQIGKDTILWGPGYHGVVGLSGVNPTFDMVRIPVKIWKIKFANVLGFLRDSDRKYLFAHRAEFSPFAGMCIGLQEVYIYDRIHISLLNPIMPYQMAEDYLGQVGNNTIEGDLDLCILPNIRLYMSLFLDDLHPKESLFTYVANTWAVLMGVLLTDPLKLKDSDFRIEYARMEPWIYSHISITSNIQTPLSYTHFGKSLGHWIGSNADDLLFEANHYFTDDLTATLSYNRIRIGEKGSSLYDYFTSFDKRFLDGIVEKTHTIKLSIKYRLFQDSMVKIDYSYIRVKNRQNEEAKLPETHELKQPWEAGYNLSQNVLQIALTLKY